MVVIHRQEAVHHQVEALVEAVVLEEVLVVDLEVEEADFNSSVNNCYLKNYL